MIGKNSVPLASKLGINFMSLKIKIIMKDKESGEMSTWLFMTIPIEKQQWHLPIILPMVHANLSIGYPKLVILPIYVIKNHSQFLNFASM